MRNHGCSNEPARRPAVRNGHRAALAGAALAVLLMFSGCATGFVYNRLDWLAMRYVDGYLPLERTQKSWLRSRLESMLAWHRSEELPEYAAWLRALRDDVAQDGAPIPWEAYYDTVDRFWQRLVRRAAGDAAALLISANAAQINSLFESFDERDEEIRKDYLKRSPAKLHDKRLSAVTRQVERWLGPLDTAQIELLRGWVEDTSQPVEQRLALRDQWQRDLQAVIGNARDRDQLAAALVALVTGAGEPAYEPYVLQVETRRERTAELLRTLHATLTPEQRRHLTRRLDALIATLDDLARAA